MKKIYCFLALTLTGNTYCNQKNLQKRAFQFTTHTLGIFIDDLERGPQCGVVAGHLKTAIEQKASPLIVSSSIFKLALSCLGDTYNPSEWINHKITDYFYLLVPSSYLASLPAPSSASYSYTARELALGLKIDHLTQISDANMKDQNFHKDHKDYGKIRTGHIAISDRFVEALGLNTKKSPLFITNREYFLAKASSYIPQWAVYILGHGQAYETTSQRIAYLNKELEQYKNNPDIQADIRDDINQVNVNERVFKEGIIANLEIIDIQKLLQFFATKITVRFAFIETCYYAGINLKKSLNNNNANFSQTYPYTLVSGAIATSPLKKFKHTDHPYNFDAFFKSITALPPIDFEQTLSTIYSFYGDNYSGTEITAIANIPTIKFAGHEWIEVLDLPNKVVSIGHTMGRTRTQPLHINRYFAGRRQSRISPEERKKRGLPPEQTSSLIYPEALLIYPTKITFPIIVQNNPKSKAPFPTIISMQAGRAIHDFVEINAPDFTLSEVIEAFLKIGNLREHKVFIIRKIKLKNNIVDTLGGSTAEPLELNTMLFITKPGATKYDPVVRELYFKYGTTNWKAPNAQLSNLEQDYDRKAVTSTLEKLNKKIRSEQKINPDSLFAVNLEKLKKELAKKQTTQAERFKKEQKQIHNIKQFAQSLADITQTRPTQSQSQRRSDMT